MDCAAYSCVSLYASAVSEACLLPMFQLRSNTMRTLESSCEIALGVDAVDFFDFWSSFMILSRRFSVNRALPLRNKNKKPKETKKNAGNFLPVRMMQNFPCSQKPVTLSGSWFPGIRRPATTSPQSFLFAHLCFCCRLICSQCAGRGRLAAVADSGVFVPVAVVPSKSQSPFDFLTFGLVL